MNQGIRYPRPPALADLGTRHAVVEASAGTGKTYLLEHLVVDLLLRRGARIEEILVVTFTERATSELCLRLRAKLTAMLHLDADDPVVQAAAQRPDQDCWIIDQAARERLRDALLAFDRATISTIHGFCRGILADHAFLNHRLFDEQAVDEEGSFHNAFVEALRQDFSVDPSLRPYLTAWLRGKSTVDLEHSLRACAQELARVFPADAAALRPAFDESAMRAALEQWPRGVQVDETLGPRLKKAGFRANTAGAILDRLNTLASLLDEHRHDLVTMLVALPQLEAGWGKNRFDYLIENLQKAGSDPVLVGLHQALVALQQARVPLLAALAPKFLPLIEARLHARKRVAGLYDFQDMLNLVAERLADTGDSSRLLLSTLRQRYRYALIDEFQDTDEVQWFIFRRLFFESREGHVLTVIGDPKQAIYRFRGADVHTYLRARREILQLGGARVRLGENFRSTKAVVDGGNAIFAEGTGFFRAGTGIDYRQPVTCGSTTRALCDAEDRPAPGMVILDVGPEGKAAEIRRALRRQIVDEIRHLLSPSGSLFVHDGPGKRPIHAGNIFVLAFTNHECRELGDSLRDAGLPYAFFRQDKLFATPEAADILDLLRALADPHDPRLRARAFLTKFFALDLPDLPFCNRPETSSPALDQLFAWHHLAERGDLGALFADILARSGIACREVGLAQNERSLTNTLHLFEVLQDEAAATHAGLRELAEMLGGFINGTRLPPGEDRDLQRLESEARAVQIMTVHASKGLEADVVFLYGGVDKSQKERLPQVFHDEHGQRVVHLGRLSAQEETLCEQEVEDEERRQLYVALTRARARLYVPRYPNGRGLCARLRPLIDQVLADPATGPLFERVPVACPGDPPLRLPAPEPAALAAWQPPASPVVSGEDYRRIARERAGFFITSYTGVKRHHGGFVVSEGPAETGSAAADPHAPTPVLPGELERGRLSGIFLHALLEELPLDLGASMEPEAWLEHPELSLLLNRLARQHDRDPRQLAHAARMVHSALFSPLRLGSQVIPGLGRQRPFLREIEFLYPIPEKSHALLGAAPDDRPFPIERGLVKGFIDVLFQYQGRIFLCDWKGDWLPSWEPQHLDLHCQNNYDVQARLYTLAVLRLANVHERTAYDDLFGGVLYCFLRGLRPDTPEAGIMFRRPEWDTVLAWQEQMLSGTFWGLS